MQSIRNMPILVMIVIVCGFNCSDLIGAWASGPYDAYGGYVFLLWMAPLLIYVFNVYSFRPESSRGVNRIAVIGGAGIHMVGIMGSLNVLQHLGFAAVLFGMAGWGGGGVWGRGAAIKWMP